MSWGGFLEVNYFSFRSGVLSTESLHGQRTPRSRAAQSVALPAAVGRSRRPVAQRANSFGEGREDFCCWWFPIFVFWGE